MEMQSRSPGASRRISQFCCLPLSRHQSQEQAHTGRIPRLPLLPGLQRCKDRFWALNLAMIGLDGACESQPNYGDYAVGPQFLPALRACTPLCDVTLLFFPLRPGV